MKNLLLILVLAVSVASSQDYQLPNDDEDCPANCRLIPWLAGSDIWNSGTLPVYTGVNCTVGLTEGDGTTDNTSAIQTCLDALSSSQAAVLPAGIFYVNGTLTMPTNVVLRGAGSDNCSQGAWLSSTFAGDTGEGAVCTTLKLGNTGNIDMGVSIDRGSNVDMLSGYTKGSTSITVDSGHGLVTNDWVVLYEQPDTAIPVTNVGAYGTCTWCGESNATNRFMSQIVQLSNVTGDVLTLSRPMYYEFKSGLSPGLREYQWDIVKSGIEDIKIHGWGTRTQQHIQMIGTLFSWVKNVELYRDADSAKAFHIYSEASYGNEVRDSYIHFQTAQSSDRAYGLGLFFSTSDWKIENNIFRELRHLGAQEGGGSGNVWIYNYMDDAHYLYGVGWHDGARLNHGAHPYMTLVEGNSASAIGFDGSWGSGSHNVIFRNWIWGDLTGDYDDFDGTNPTELFNAIRIDIGNVHYSVVGNVLGRDGLNTTWSAAQMHPTDCDTGTRAVPVVYWVSCDDNFPTSYVSAAWDTLIKHGNYDMKTDGVADWDGGANHDLEDSMYYDSKPSFFGDCVWPPFGPEPTTSKLPAEARYDDIPCPPAYRNKLSGLGRMAGGVTIQ